MSSTDATGATVAAGFGVPAAAARSPATGVLSLYFLQGLPFFMVNVVAGLMLKSLAAPPFLQGPYVDVTQGLRSAMAGGAKVLIWAFATGDCRQERWVDGDSAAFVRQQVAALQRNRPGLRVSTRPSSTRW